MPYVRRTVTHATFSGVRRRHGTSQPPHRSKLHVVCTTVCQTYDAFFHAYRTWLNITTSFIIRRYARNERVALTTNNASALSWRQWSTDDDNAFSDLPNKAAVPDSVLGSETAVLRQDRSQTGLGLGLGLNILVLFPSLFDFRSRQTLRFQFSLKMYAFSCLVSK